jgi:hypothetical protein
MLLPKPHPLLLLSLQRIEAKKKQLAEAEFNCASLEDALKEKEDTLKYLQEELRELQVSGKLLRLSCVATDRVGWKRLRC